LPEAQLDRFMLNLWLDYPSFAEEVQIVKSTTSKYEASVERVLSASEIIEFQNLVRVSLLQTMYSICCSFGRQHTAILAGCHLHI